MSSLKMSKESSQLKQQTENRYLNMSSETWKKEVTRVRGEYSARLKQALHTNGNECSSLGSYPTPQASEEKYRIGGNTQASKCLTAMARRGELDNWPTPRETMSRDATYDRGKCNLGEVVHNPKNWATPQASDHVEGARTATESNQKCLGRDLARLDGPQDPVSNSTSGKNQGLWPTPRSAMTGDATPERLNDKERNMEKVVAQTGQTGKLNPNWVEQLMGLPIGWTDLGSWVTE
jgi:hypothetical protein